MKVLHNQTNAKAGQMSIVLENLSITKDKISAVLEEMAGLLYAL